MREPLIGRSPELGAIHEAIARSVRQRSPAALLVIGEPGSGKSHLLAESMSRARPQVRLDVVGHEPELDVPLSAIRVPLRRLADESADATLKRMLDPATDASHPLEPIRLFEATHTAIAARRVILAVDDLQWVDRLTRALIYFLVRAAVAQRQALALIAMSRPNASAHAFADELDAVIGSAAVERLELGPLDRESASALAQRVMPGLDSERATEVATRAGGSPFWIELLARTADRGDDATEVVAQRFRRLDTDSRDLLGLLAVLGRPVEAVEVREIRGWDEDRLMHAISDLHAAGLLGSSGPSVWLSHDLIREAALRGLPQATRRDLHRRVAAHLEDEAPEDLHALAEALDHRLAAGDTPVGLARRVATSPRRRLLGSDGLRLLDSIADALAGDDVEASRLRLELAQLATEVGEHESARRRWTALADTLEVPEERVRAALEAARLSFHFGGPDEIRASMERLRALGRPDPWLGVAVDALEASVIVWREHRVAGGGALARETLETARALAAQRSGDALGQAERRAYLAALRIAYEAATQAEEWESLEALADEAIATARGLEADRIDALVMRGLAVRTNGHYGPASDVFLQAWEDARRAVLPAQTVTAGNWTARAMFDLGRIDEAASIAGEVSRLVDRVGDESLLRGVTHVVRHEIQLLRGDWRAAVSSLLAEADGLDPHYALAVYQWAAVWIARVGGGGQADEVSQLLHTAMQEALTAECPRCRGELELYSLEARLRVLDNVERAAPELADWDVAHPRPDARRALHRRWVGALAEARLGAEPAAAAELDLLRREADQRSMAVDAAWLELDRANALASTAPEAAIVAFGEARVRATAIGATTLIHLADQGGRALGVRAWRPSGRAGVGVAPALTSRELEVARLVASGASNPEIAARLFLSRKTVERHVSNALLKVGARNRTELATRLRDDAGA